ncbi:MAG TPA: GDP-mannose 4,6-dehydratase, partial [Mycobacterium sp.]|nr:GDP-mannose 4,6-dehydratase [Mycobacterium sp.]
PADSFDWTDKSVLVTGGAGFIGSYLVELLTEASAQVTVFDTLTSGARENLASVANDVTLNNVGAGREYTSETLAKSLCKLTGLTPAFDYSGANRPGDPEKLVVDITRLQSIGYTPQTEFEEGLAAVVQWFEDLTGETWK